MGRKYFMEFLLELVLEIVLEGSLELVTEKKIPMPLRILALLVFLGIFGGLCVVFICIGLDAMNTRPAVGWLFLIIAVLLAVVVVYAFRKKWREKRRDS